MNVEKHRKAFEFEHLRDGEAIERIHSALLVKNVLRGILVLTNQRLCYYREKMTGNEFEGRRLSDISAVHGKSTMSLRKLTVKCSNDDLELYVDSTRSEFDGLCRRIDELRDDAPEPRRTAAPDPLEQIEKLGQLREKGLLSEAEFATQKAELLARL